MSGVLPAEAEVRAVLAHYFDGLYHGDTGLLEQVFHPEAVYATATEGPLLRLTMPEYFPVVARREPPPRGGRSAGTGSSPSSSRAR